MPRVGAVVQEFEIFQKRFEDKIDENHAENLKLEAILDEQNDKIRHHSIISNTLLAEV